jgi:hypothetical protein
MPRSNPSINNKRRRTMNTKNIFKTLALAMLMPAMLLTTACSNEDDLVNNTANTENTINKGYALPVTVNVTRQGDAGTRATYTDNGDGTGSLNFSAGDKLFVQGNHENAGLFAGTLDYDAVSGKFSGTIYTKNSYSGTIDALFTAGSARLLPAGYETPGYLSINNSGTYNASFSCDASKTFATTKAIAVEQFSYEMSTTYSSGFALSPWNAILNFTITGLTASTEVTASFTNGSNVISGNVTTDGSGNATFAIGVAGDTNLQNCSLTVGGNAITLTSSDKYLTAGKIYNIARSALITSPAVGQVIGNDGKNYAAGSLPSGVTAVAIITYVGSDNGEAAPYNHGLALAMSDANSGSTFKWKTSNTDAGHTKQDDETFEKESGLQYNTTHNTDEYPAFQAAIANNGTAAPTGCSAWFLASGYQWTKMFAGDAGGLKTLAGLQSSRYWSSSESSNEIRAWCFVITSGNDFWYNDGKESDRLVRSCLAF